MAGARGKSGGPRPNSGGRRAGAGRKPDPPVLVDDPALATVDPEEWLKAAMNSKAVPMKYRVQAAGFLRQRPIAPLEVMDALYMRAMQGSVSAQIAYLRPWMRKTRNK